MQDYRKIVAWRKARALVVAVSEATRGWPANAAPGLRSQLMRATMSISSNIVEGAMRESRVDFARFLTMAISSAGESEHHLCTCEDLGLLAPESTGPLTERVVEVRRMLFGLRATVLRAAQAERVKPRPPSPPRE